jgi:phosphatidate cytidylyltransferase
LNRRIWSAVVMVAVGAAEIWVGGTSFALLVICLISVMIWELSAITAPSRRNTPLGMAAIAACSLAVAIFLRADIASAFLMVPALAMALTPRRDRRLSAASAGAIMIAGYGLVMLRDEGGTPVVLWVLGVVIISDVLGYFAGRLIGGPKFWPRISPKKTWSGTIAGWIGAALVGAGFVVMGHANGWLIVLSPLVALAGQLSDIGESWIKRRAGVKDSSNLIPGHGGVMDRFDALTGAVVAVMLIRLVTDLPVPAQLGGG